MLRWRRGVGWVPECVRIYIDFQRLHVQEFDNLTNSQICDVFDYFLFIKLWKRVYNYSSLVWFYKSFIFIFGIFFNYFLWYTCHMLKCNKHKSEQNKSMRQCKNTKAMPKLVISI